MLLATRGNHYRRIYDSLNDRSGERKREKETPSPRPRFSFHPPRYDRSNFRPAGGGGDSSPPLLPVFLPFLLSRSVTIARDLVSLFGHGGTEKRQPARSCPFALSATIAQQRDVDRSELAFEPWA